MTYYLHTFRNREWFRKRRMWILEQPDDTILALAKQIRVPFKLKKVDRYKSPRDPTLHQESVGEHVFALYYLASYFAPLEYVDGNLNLEFVRDILTYHDLLEIVHGDEPYHTKTSEDKVRELATAPEVFGSLPPELRDYAEFCWRAYYNLDTEEGKFAKALDKMEPLFELADPVNETSMMRLAFTYEDHIGIKLKVTEQYPVMRRFVDVMSEDMKRRNVFWKPPAQTGV